MPSTSEIDVLPTLREARRRHAARPTARSTARTSGRCCRARRKQSPHEALFYFNGNRLRGRALPAPGSWPSSSRSNTASIGTGARPAAVRAKLYNLDADIGETTDVAAQHPDVVKRLQGYLQQMDRDLGATGRGPGMRASGRVDHPQPLLLRNAMEYD